MKRNSSSVDSPLRETPARKIRPTRSVRQSTADFSCIPSGRRRMNCAWENDGPGTLVSNSTTSEFNATWQVKNPRGEREQHTIKCWKRRDDGAGNPEPAIHVRTGSRSRNAKHLLGDDHQRSS